MSELRPKPDSSDVFTYTGVRILVFLLLFLGFLYYTGGENLRLVGPPFPANMSVEKQWTLTFGLFVAGAWLVAFVRDNSREYPDSTLGWYRVWGIVMVAVAIGWRLLLFP